MWRAAGGAESEGCTGEWRLMGGVQYCRGVVLVGQVAAWQRARACLNAHAKGGCGRAGCAHLAAGGATAGGCSA